jgi:hypothetical protein
VRVLFTSFAHCTGFPGQPESDSPWFERAYGEMNAAVADAAVNTGSSFFDLAARIPDERALFVDPVHMTEAGCELQGRLVAEFLHGSEILAP